MSSLTHVVNGAHRFMLGPAEAARLLRTVRHLKPVQIYGRALTRLPGRALDVSPAPRRRPVQGAWAAPVQRPRSLLRRWQVQLLNEEGAIASPQGWNDPARSKLWLYNLHYFDDLAGPGDERHVPAQRELVERWITENPVGEGNGWEPYPVSLRVANWIKWALGGVPLAAHWQDSLALQVRWLEQRIEWHLLGNHLLANAKALVLAGLFYAGEEAERWLSRGLAIYARELPEQVLADGGHFELSPMYHATILEDLLDLLNAAHAYGCADRAPFRDLPQIIARMRHWLAAMTHPDGGPAFFNDCAFGIAPSCADLEGYAGRLGLATAGDIGEGVHHLAASGYVRVNLGAMAAILDLAAIGPDYIPGHAHADTLSFEMSLGRERVLVNSGTSVYAPGALRNAQRATRAHNTVELDGESSSEVWASFRVGRRARVCDVRIAQSDAGVQVGARHDGYRHLRGRPSHARTWHLSAGSLRVHDVLAGTEGRGKRAAFHLAPGIAAATDPAGLAGKLQTQGGCSLRWHTSSAAGIEPGSWYREFGTATANAALVVPFTASELTTTIAWV